MDGKNWKEEDRKYVMMRRITQQTPHKYLTNATALKNMKDFAGVESVAYEGIRIFPSNIELYKAYAYAAIQQEHWHDAQERCATIREKFPYHIHGYLLGAATFRGMGEYNVAEDILRQGIDKCPAEESLYVAHAYLAMCRKDYDEAFKRWALVREKFREFPLSDFHLESTTRCKISTIILSYNHENHIAGAIESALRQVGDFEHEIIVSDDGSTDNTRQIIEEYCKKYPNIINISEEKNVGNPENYRRCIAAASGDYIAILEGDDFWIDPYKLLIQINVIQHNDDCCTVCSGRYHIDYNNFFVTKSRIMKTLTTKIFGPDIVLKKSETDCFSHWLVDAKLVKTAPINDLCLYKDDEKYFVVENLFIIWLSNRYNKKIILVNERLFIHLTIDYSTWNSLESIQQINGLFNQYQMSMRYATEDQYRPVESRAYYFQQMFKKLRLSSTSL